MERSTKLPAHYFYDQFHNTDHYSPDDHVRKEWYEMYDGVPEDHQGKPVSYARGGEVKKRQKENFGSHPAHKIPGIHIVTAETGEPVFTGEK